jgi:hypothetical protein
MYFSAGALLRKRRADQRAFPQAMAMLHSHVPS